MCRFVCSKNRKAETVKLVPQMGADGCATSSLRQCDVMVGQKRLVCINVMHTSFYF